MNDLDKTIYRFESFCLDSHKRVLLKSGEPVQLTQKCFEVLLTLVSRAGETIEKEALMRAVWSDTVVEEANLIQAVSTLRKVLGEKKNEHRFIVTVTGRGYRFVAEVEKLSEGKATQELALTTPVKIQDAPDDKSETSDNSVVRLSETEVGRDERQQNTPIYKSFPRLAMAAGCLAALAILMAFWNALPFKKSSAHAPSINSIAVLPFRSLTHKSEEYLETGLADALITKISKLKKIKVAPTSAVVSYKDNAQDPVSAGKELSADAVLEGNIQKVGERFRVSARLVRVSDGIPLWAENFDENATDIFALQDKISENVTEALRLSLTGEEKRRLASRSTANGEAYKAYLHGLFFLEKRSEDGLKRSVEYFERAAALDKNFAAAFARQADAYSLLAFNREGDLPPAEYYLRAKAAALKALELDPELAEPHASLGLVYNAFENDSEKSAEHFRRAIELNPDYATARQWHAWHLLVHGNTAGAIEEMKRAQELEPLSLIIATDLAMFYFYARNYDAAIETSRKALEMDADFAPARLALGLALEQKGNLAQAVKELETASQKSNRNGDALAALAHASAAGGNTARARQILGELRERYKNQQAAPVSILTVYASLKDRKQVDKWLLEAKKVNDSFLFQLWVDPRLAIMPNLPKISDANTQ